MPKVDWEGDAQAKRAEDAVKNITRITAENVLGASHDLCPLSDETTVPGGPHGALRASGHVSEVKGGYEIAYEQEYALVMHESQNYTPSHPGTGPNYLRQPLLDAEDQYHKDIADALKAIWG